MMAASRNPQHVGNYELNSGEAPSRKDQSIVWYYEHRGSIGFHLDIFNGTDYRGHVTFKVQRSKLLKSLRRLDKG